MSNRLASLLTVFVIVIQFAFILGTVINNESNLKSAQEIIVKLESSEMSKIEWTEQYERMMQLNNHIQNKFKQKAKEIKKSNLFKNKED